MYIKRAEAIPNPKMMWPVKFIVALNPVVGNWRRREKLIYNTVVPETAAREKCR